MNKLSKSEFEELKVFVRNWSFDDTRRLCYPPEARLAAEAGVIEDLIGEIWAMLPDDIITDGLKEKLARVDLLSMGHTANLQLFFGGVIK